MSKKKTETGAEMIEIVAEPEAQSEAKAPPEFERKATEVVVATFDPARPAHQTMIEGVLANLRKAGERMQHEIVQGATEILVRSFTASAEQILSAAWGGQAPPAWMGLTKSEG